MNGQVHTGLLSRFTPSVPDITLSLGPGTREKMRFAAEQVAYVGFHRAHGEPPARPQMRKASLKIHVSGGKTFLVDPAEPETPGGVGFYTRPAEPQSPFKSSAVHTHCAIYSRLTWWQMPVPGGTTLKLSNAVAPHLRNS